MRQTLHQPPARFGRARARWRLADLRAVLPWLQHYSLSGICRALRRLGIRRRRGRLGLQSPDLAYQPKLAWLARARTAAQQQPAPVRLLYADEFSLYRWPTLAPVYTPRGTEPVAHCAARSNTRRRYSGALDIVSGRVVWTSGDKMGVVGLCQFLRAVRAAYPAQALVLVWDNWSQHLHPRVLEQAALLEIGLLWLPTYAPWTNPIEKLWRWLRQDLLHHHRLADAWSELQAAVATFLDQFAAGSADLLRYVGAIT